MHMNLSKIILAVIIAFFLLDNTLGFMLQELSKKSSFRYAKLYTEPINADVVFVGNSIAVNAFHSPSFNKITGLKSFNLSFNGLTFPIINILISDYLQHNAKPKVVYIEISGLSNKPSDMLSNFKQYIPYSELFSARIKDIYPSIYYTSLASKSFAYNSEFSLRTLYYLLKDDQEWINMGSISKSSYKLLDFDTRHELLLREMTNLEINQFSDMVKTLSSQGVRVVPVMAPVIDKYYDKEEVHKYISNFERDTGSKVINLSDSVSDVEMFSDSIHTNIKGATLIMKKLILISKDLDLI